MFDALSRYDLVADEIEQADRTRSALFGFDNSRISDVAARTARLAASFLPAPASSVKGRA